MTTAAPIKIAKETFQIETTRIRLEVNQRLQPNSRKISISNQPTPNLKQFEKNCLKILKSRPIRKKSLEMKMKNLNLIIRQIHSSIIFLVRQLIHMASESRGQPRE